MNPPITAQQRTSCHPSLAQQSLEGFFEFERLTSHKRACHAVLRVAAIKLRPNGLPRPECSGPDCTNAGARGM
ncbi:hypothetical protein Y032_0184g977 [Ancylostoma ceylanicum]|uniref:Uncharacterized protein n=1 Tax=Ancylostoma ceylanicum TaxID=53326 RepID=A0A016SRB9_9BILA|nr:hypothetical protein Y032_0184g977 [Ancylostoma ceylanicum]